MEKRSAAGLAVPKNSADFVVRGHSYAAMRWLAIALSFIMLALSVALYVNDELTVTSTLFIVIGGLLWYVSIYITRSHRLLSATEFQNALFSSALAMGGVFCIIVTRDGGFVYFDRQFQTAFPEFMAQPARSLEVFLDMGGVSAADRASIQSAVKNGAYEKLSVKIRAAEGETREMTWFAEPILRPSGYVLLRGHDASKPPIAR